MGRSCQSSAFVPQVSAEVFETLDRLSILLAVCRPLAGDDVVDRADHEALDFYPPRPSVGEALDPVRRVDQVEIERAVFQLDEILAPARLFPLLVGQVETQIHQRRTTASPFSGDRSTYTSASWVVSGYPSRIAPLLPRNK